MRRVKAQHLTSGSLPRGEMVCLGGDAVAPPETTAVLPGAMAKPPPAPLLPFSVSDKMQDKAPPQQRKLRAEARLAPERATSLRLAALVRASRAGPTSGRSSPLGERDDSPATVMSIDVGGVPSPLAKPRGPGANSPASPLAAPKSPATVMMSTPDRVAPKAAATPTTAAALRAVATSRAATAHRAGAWCWGAAAPAAAAGSWGGDGAERRDCTVKRTRAPGDTGDAARPPRQPRLQPTFIDALHVPAFALDTPAQLSPTGQTLSSPQVVASFLAHPSPLARNFDSRKLVMKQRQQHIAHSAFMQRKQYLPENRPPMTSECTKAPESDMSRAQVVEVNYASILDHVEAMILLELEAKLEAVLEAEVTPYVASTPSNDPPSTQRARGAPGAPLRPLVIARRRVVGECRWACDDDRWGCA